MARNEINSKLSEINVFLEEKSKEQSETEKSREEVMDKIQKDLGDRLQTSRTELAAIKAQMKGEETLYNSGTTQFGQKIFQAFKSLSFF